MKLETALSGKAPCGRCQKGLMYLEKRITPTHIVLKCSYCGVRDEIKYDEEKNEIILINNER